MKMLPEPDLNEMTPPDDFELMGADEDLLEGETVGANQTTTRRTTDLVRLYLQEIGRVQLLRRDEEVSEAQYVQRYMQ
ncbi:MAG: RNA polymerase sigma factor, RpoD/SigA family, partial [Leptolyngbya sp. SIO1D8]|nr:RNA polymerase sigma factor, RpoD/SigA family [Leptolyngbya sp. SIO1D8]